MTAPASRRAMPDDKVIRFETPANDAQSPAPAEPSFLRALDDEPGFDLDGAESPGCILDFEYNGVPARHGFIRD